jgi:hypothetical protein
MVVGSEWYVRREMVHELAASGRVVLETGQTGTTHRCANVRKPSSSTYTASRPYVSSVTSLMTTVSISELPLTSRRGLEVGGGGVTRVIDRFNWNLNRLAEKAEQARLVRAGSRAHEIPQGNRV